VFWTKYKHKLVTYTNAAKKRKFPETDNTHLDQAFSSQPEKNSQHV